MPRDYSRLDTTAFTRDTMSAHAVVVGAGALGNEVLKNLALLGLRSLTIIDRDRVERSNLTRSILYCTPDVDTHIATRTPKATLAAQRVREINPDVTVTAIVAEVADVGAGVLRRADVIFSCLDNEMARLELSWLCNRLDKRLIDGGLGLLNYSSGMVSVFPGRSGPCYACRKTPERRRRLLQGLYGREDPCWQKAVAADDTVVATTPLLASIVGAMQVEFALRANPATDDREVGRAYEVTLFPKARLDPFSFHRQDSCPLHASESAIEQIVERHDRCSGQWTVAALLKDADCADGALLLDWPLTARAQCQTCGQRWEPMLRRARMRRTRCPHCGGAEVAELETITSISAESAWAERTLGALGLPPGHIHEAAVTMTDGSRRVHIEATGDLLTQALPCAS